MSGPRVERVADLIRRELAGLISGELRDPRIGFVTVTEVTVTSDLRYARVYVTTLGSGAGDTIAALRHAAPFLRRELGRRTVLRFTPELRFELDPSAEGGRRVERILNDIERERIEQAPDDEDEASS